MRFPTSPDPWEAELEELDRIYEQWPVSERPLFPPVPGPIRQQQARSANAIPLALALTAPARPLLVDTSVACGSGQPFTRED